VPKFLAKLDGNAVLNFLSHRQCDTHDVHNSMFQLTASDWAIWAGDTNSHMCTEV